MISDLAHLITALSFACVAFFFFFFITTYIRVLNAPKPVTELRKKKPPSLTESEIETMTYLENISNFGTGIPQKEYK